MVGTATGCDGRIESIPVSPACRPCSRRELQRQAGLGAWGGHLVCRTQPERERASDKVYGAAIKSWPGEVTGPLCPLTLL